jgi:hypothetical protein
LKNNYDKAIIFCCLSDALECVLLSIIVKTH